MDAWETPNNGADGLSSDGVYSGESSVLNYTDTLLSKIFLGKKELQVALESTLESNDENRPLYEVLISSSDGDAVTLESNLRNNPELIDIVFPEDSGVTCLIYAICFDNYEIVDTLLNVHNADPDLPDTIVHYTPLMWAVYLNKLPMVKLLLNQQADPYLSPQNDGKSAARLVNPENTLLYEYLKSHNILDKHFEAEPKIFESGYVPNEDPLTDDLSVKLKLESMADKNFIEESDDEAEPLNEEAVLARDPIIAHREDFDYSKLLPNSYIKFTDSDIPSILDYIFNLRTSKLNYQHDTKVPAALLFQLVRFSHLKVNSKELTEFLFQSFNARLRSVTNTKSGVFNMAVAENMESAGGASDIVLLAYWLSSIQFLHFYFAKGKIYYTYPKFLQEIINIVQSLIATLSFSINSRLNALLEDCLLNFTSLIDVSNVLYAKDWNLFKNKKSLPITYEDIFDMLFPPSQSEQMKPSPIRYIQVLGALDYVLGIHEVDNLLKIETYSQVFYYVNASIFNHIISNSKYCSRAKAIQIRLNVSAIEDWLRSHNFKPYRPENPGQINRLFGDSQVELHNILIENSKDKRKPGSLAFYYNSLYSVGKTQLQPTIELLQWLQCMSLMQDEDSLISTINQFDTLNYYQLYKVVHKLYRYEVDEPRVPKKLTNVIRSLAHEQGEKQIQASNLHYMTQSTFLIKEIYVYLNPNFIFNAALPNLAELINNYGSGLGGIKVYRSKKYQPSLPMEISDDIDEFLTRNRSTFNDTYDYEREQEADTGKEEHHLVKEEPFQGDSLFKSVQIPNSLAHKNWGDDDLEENPW